MPSYKNTVPQDMECSLDRFFSQAGRENNSQIVFALGAFTKLLYLVNYPDKMQKQKQTQTEKKIYLFIYLFKN